VSIGGEVDRLEHLERRFSEHVRTLHERMRDDASFRELCADYEDAAAAMIYWLSPPLRSENRAKDYRDLMSELESEIEAALRGA
jgi:hypothetical protein